MTVISTTLDPLGRPTEEITSEGFAAEQKTPLVPTRSAAAVLSEDTSTRLAEAAAWQTPSLWDDML